jgi:hypothetical protein
MTADVRKGPDPGLTIRIRPTFSRAVLRPPVRKRRSQRAAAKKNRLGHLRGVAQGAANSVGGESLKIPGTICPSNGLMRAPRPTQTSKLASAFVR